MMRICQFVTMLALSCTSLAVGEVDCQKEFDVFVNKYHKVYASDEERELRNAIFLENCKWIQKENQRQTAYEVGITEFADLRFAEFKGKFQIPEGTPPPPVGRHVFKGIRVPDRVDWVEEGAVTLVKNQNPCGTCWAFAAAATIESAVKIHGGDLISLSTQELQDCMRPQKGCRHPAGRHTPDAFEYTSKNGLASYEQYPYIWANEACKSGVQRQLQPGQVSTWNSVDADPESLMEVVAQQPVAIILNFDPVEQHYKKGIIFQETCAKGSNHAVVAVGYGTENGVGYWKLRNSWGTEWGEEGYFRIVRGKDACGLLDDATYPVVQGQFSKKWTELGPSCASKQHKDGSYCETCAGSPVPHNPDCKLVGGLNMSPFHHADCLMVADGKFDADQCSNLDDPSKSKSCEHMLKKCSNPSACNVVNMWKRPSCTKSKAQGYKYCRFYTCTSTPDLDGKGEANQEFYTMMRTDSIVSNVATSPDIVV